jgi:hypothetical protein
MPQTDQEKLAEILKKRELAAKGLKERGDGKPVDPLADYDSLDPDDRDATADTPEEKMKEAVDGAAVAGLAMIRSGG